MSRILYYTILILLIIQLSLLAQFAGGSGTEADPWLIRTPQNLDSLRYYLGADNADKYYKQIADIDLGVAPWNVGEGWEPVGRDSTFFMGDYDGDGFKISNLYIDRSTEDYIGLFGSIQNANLSNIGVINAAISGKMYVGALVGLNPNGNGIISNCFSSGMVYGEDYTGGLIGSLQCYWLEIDWSSNPKIFNCYSRCRVIGNGGFIGSSGGFNVTKFSYSTGKITGTLSWKTGGFNGYCIYDFTDYNYWDTETSEMLTSFSALGRTTAEMTEYCPNTYENWDFENIWAEDIYGLNDGYPVLQCQLPKNVPAIPEITTVEINDMDFHIYWNNPAISIAGNDLTDLTKIYITRNGFVIHIIDSPIIGGNENFTDILTEPGYYTYRIYGENSAGLGLLCKISNFIGQMFPSGTGTEVDPYLIGTPDHLNSIRIITGLIDKKKYFKQTSDIDMNVAPWNDGDYWEPINYFTDSYDGNGYKISNLIIYLPENDEVGLFGDTKGAVIKNLELDNAGIVGRDYTGCLVGSAEESSFYNIKCSVNLTGDDFTGGIVGKTYVGSFSDCSISGTITGDFYVGGLSGSVFMGNIENAISSCTIYCGSYSGGLIGKFEGMGEIMIKSSCSESNIYATGNDIGGITGYIMRAQISESFSKGLIEGGSYLGGIIGWSDESTNISDCYSMTDIEYSYSDGFGTGGFSGCLDAWSDIKNSYSTGRVRKNDGTGYGFGFSGCIYSLLDIINCYWDTETSGTVYSQGGEGRTTAEMTAPNLDSTYNGWDFVNTWQIDPLLNGGYPYLKWQNLTGIEEQTGLVPNEFTLLQNYPNPFNPVTKISYSLPQGFSGDVKLSIYNANGQLVKELVNEKKSSGIYSVELNASDLNSGLYIYRLKTENSDISKKMILLK